MTELNLLDALVARLTELFRNYELPAKSGLLQNVRVFAQYLPQPSAVTVDTDTDEDTDTEPQSYMDVLNIIEQVRQDLLTMPARVLAKRYRLEMPLKSYLFDEQAWPIYFGQIETVWETGRPLMPRNFERCF